MPKKRKGCRNCKHGDVIRKTYAFPDIYCRLSKEGGWDAVMSFGHCCDKHEWRFNSRICPKCNGRATKIYTIGAEKPHLCQQCRHEYSRESAIDELA